jgi:hypothetical protein
MRQTTSTAPLLVAGFRRILAGSHLVDLPRRARTLTAPVHGVRASTVEYGGTMRRFTTRMAIVALATVAAALAAVAVPGPAQAAPPERISEAQVLQTVNRSTIVSVPFDGSVVELRAGWYGGYQYGWARLRPGAANWQEGHAIVLQISRGSGWEWGPDHQNVGDGVAHTGGALTYASPSYRFRACLFNGYGHACTDPW